MLVNMLKAIDNMLPKATDDLVIYKTKVECARSILLGVIAELTENPNPVSKDKNPQKLVLEPKAHLEPRPEVITNGDEWMITIDEKKGLKIVDFPLDGLVELDGKKMTYGEARGQVFKKARIL